MIHWGSCIGPTKPLKYDRDDPIWEVLLLHHLKPYVMPISPCPTHRHKHSSDNLTAPHVPSYNKSVEGIVP